MSAREPGLEVRFRDAVAREAGRVGDGPLVVAVSGGLDSVVLLHLLRFTRDLPRFELRVAHFDHALRDRSDADAAWVHGLCRAWGLRCDSARAQGLTGSEEASRNARLAFLERVRRAAGARWVALGHHADDQAETVLHRVARGTGVDGLGAMEAFREPGLWRPLLPFWREELAQYAADAGLAWREDPTNLDPSHARNVLRREVLPALEGGVAPGARRALVRLAELARTEGAAWDAALTALDEQLGVRREPDGRVSCERHALLRLPEPLRARVLRRLAAEVGARLDRAATRTATGFAGSGASGRAVPLPGGIELRRDLDRLSFGPHHGPEDDVPIVIAKAEAGEAIMSVGGRTLRVAWGGEPAEDLEPRRVTILEPKFPLTVRARRDGDRIELGYGTKKLKKLLLEARIPESERRRLPVVVDADDRVLWVPGVALAVPQHPDGASTPFHIEIDDAD